MAPTISLPILASLFPSSSCPLCQSPSLFCIDLNPVVPSVCHTQLAEFQCWLRLSPISSVHGLAWLNPLVPGLPCPPLPALTQQARGSLKPGSGPTVPQLRTPWDLICPRVESRAPYLPPHPPHPQSDPLSLACLQIRSCPRNLHVLFLLPE